MDATNVAQEPQRVEKAKIRVKASCYHKRQGHDGGDEFNEVTLPKGLFVDGATSAEGRELGTVDVGRHKLYPRYVTMERDEELGGEVAAMTYKADKTILLRHYIKANDRQTGEWKWVRDSDILVNAVELSRACDAYLEQAKQEKSEQEAKAHLTFPAECHKEIVGQYGPFHSITVPDGVVVNGALGRNGNPLGRVVDVGGYTYNPKYVSPGPKEGQVSCVLPPKNEVWLRRYERDEEGRIVHDDSGCAVVSGFAKVGAKELERALDVARGREQTARRSPSVMTREELEALPTEVRVGGPHAGAHFAPARR